MASVDWTDPLPHKGLEHSASRRSSGQAWRRLREDAPIARPVPLPPHRHLTVEAEDRAPDVRLAQQDTGVVDEVARREVVGAVDDDVVVADDVEGVARVERHVVTDDLDVRVDAMDGGLGGLGLEPAQVGVRVDDLAVQVRQLDDVSVDDTDRPDASRGEVEQRGRAEPAGADDEDLPSGDRSWPSRPTPGMRTCLARVTLFPTAIDPS